MKSKEIISSIHQLFQKFRIPPNLQEHMFRAAAVGNLICDHWNGPEIDLLPNPKGWGFPNQ